MKRLLPIVVVLASACFGCSKSSGVAEVPEDGVTEAPVIYAPPVHQPANSYSASYPQATLTAPQPTFASSPDVAVTNFLAALRDGDEATAELLLTTKAIEETSKCDLKVSPPGNPSADFRVGEVSYVTADQRGAHVSCTWSELDSAGQEASYEIVWALRRQQEGWKIAGMATTVTENGPQVFLNFEDPDDMKLKWQEAERAVASQYQDNGVRQASRPDGSIGPQDTRR